MNQYILADRGDFFLDIVLEDITKLFDDSIYSKNRLMRCIGTSKPDENRPLVLKEGTIEDTLITDITGLDEFVFVLPEKAEKSSEKLSEKSSEKETTITRVFDISLLKKLAECYSPERINGYKTWTELGWAFVNVFGKSKEVEDIFVGLNDRVPSRKSAHEKQEAREWFQYKCEKRSNHEDNLLGMGSLRKWAREDNPEIYDKYFKVKIEPMKRIIHYPWDIAQEPNEEDGKCKEITECSSTDVATAFMRMYSNKFICVDDIAYMYTGVYWEKQTGIQTFIHRFLTDEAMKDWEIWYEHTNNYMLEAINREKEFGETNIRIKILEKAVKNLDNYHKYLRRMVLNITSRKPLVVEIMIKASRKIEMNRNPFLFAFENKVYDISKAEFIEPNPEDYLTCSCGWSWDDNYDPSRTVRLNAVLDTIFPDKTVRAFYLECLSTGLYGQLVEHLFISTGTGGNGKSLLHGLMLSCVGNYGYVLPSSALLGEIKQGPNPQIANLDEKRFVLTQEPDANKRMNTNTMKDLTGNKTFNVRDLYSSKSSITLRMSLFLEANTLPLLDSITGDNAQAIIRRLIATPYVSSFVSQDVYDSLEDKTNLFVGDSSLKSDTFQTDHRQALFIILVEHFKTYMNNKMAVSVMPPPCHDILKKYYMMSDDFMGWFNDAYEKDEKSYVYISSLFEHYKISTAYENLTKAERRKITKAAFDEQIFKNMFLKRSYRDRDTYFPAKVTTGGRSIA